MSSNLLSAELCQDVRKLILSLTDFHPEEEEQNFSLCYDYITSNLLYHNCLDPQAKEVDKNIKGLEEKLRIHAERKKADKLRQLVDKIDSDPIFREPHPQFDIKIRILALLLHLSEAPLTAEWNEELEVFVQEEEVKEEEVNWREILAEGEEVWRPSGGDSDLSEWSDDEDQVIIEGNKKEPVQIQGPKEQVQQGPNELMRQLKSLIQPDYWLPNQTNNPTVDSDNVETADFVSKLDRIFISKGVAPTVKVKLSEYQLIRECLWMIYNPSESTVFRPDFRLKESVCIPSVSPESLANFLATFTSFLEDLRILQDFSKFVFRDPNVPFTYQAYSSGLEDIMRLLVKDANKLEKKVSAQNETFTLMEFKFALRKWMGIIGFLRKSHLKATETSGDLSNWEKSIQLVASLSHSLQSTVNHDIYGIVVNLFLLTLHPYLKIMDVWLCKGRLEDYRNEFLFIRDNKVQPKDDSFWKKGFIQRPYIKFLEKRKLELPSLLEKTLPKIFVSGKSIQILTILKETNAVCDTPSTELSQAFIRKLKEELRMPNIDTKVVNSDPCESANSELDLSFDDPYLALAFAEAAKSVEKKPLEEKQDFFILRDLDPIFPILLVFERCFEPLITTFYKSSCESLLDLFRNTLHLEKHLTFVRKIYFMEDGDLLLEFYSEIIRRLEEEEDLEEKDLDDLSATLLLRDCIGRRYPEEANRFVIQSKEEQDFNLADIRLKYHVEWPLNIVLDSASLQLYNKVFVFLLQIKKSLWNLEQIQAKDIVSKMVSENLDCDPETDLKMHRILLLRYWLFHFLGTLHSYFMTRVLHSTALELNQALSECADLDELARVHAEFIKRMHDRCFLHSTSNVLLKAVDKVINVASELRHICRKEALAEMKMDRLLKLEETYANSHQFLASTMVAMTRKRLVPHLEGLAAALVHSCPQKVMD